MNYRKQILFVFILVLSITYFSCDDAGQDPNQPRPPKGQITFTHANLKPIDPYMNGLYVLWLALDSSGNRTWYDLGHFNVTTSGEITDSLGNTPFTFTFTGDTNSLVYATKSTVTLGYDPVGSVLIGADLVMYSDSATGDFWMANDLAFGDVGKRLLAVPPFPRANGGYMLNSPTTNNAQCTRGIWFCDTNQVTTFTPELILNPGNGWHFEAWLHNRTTNEYYSLGKFFNFYNADLDGAGPCAGTSGPGYNYPGQDFISSTPPCPTIPAFNNVNFDLTVTIEPEWETGAAVSKPFYLVLFGVSSIYSGCNIVKPLPNQNVLGLYPTGKIKITK